MLPFFNKKKKVASKIGIGGTAESSRRANQKLPSIPPSKDRPISMESDMDLSDRGVVYSRIQDKGMTYASISSRPGQEYQACRGLLRDPMITGGVDDVDAEGTESEESRVYERLKLQRWTDSSQSADGSTFCPCQVESCNSDNYSSPFFVNVIVSPLFIRFSVRAS
eukprot:m.107354 g.107354  ORF g.107354 m.107354 type:complete len:166 (+) comp16917_c0_seq1:115-612(+)